MSLMQLAGSRSEGARICAQGYGQQQPDAARREPRNLHRGWGRCQVTLPSRVQSIRAASHRPLRLISTITNNASSDTMPAPMIPGVYD